MTPLEKRVFDLENKVFELETQLQVMDKMATATSLSKIEELLNMVAECNIRTQKLTHIVNTQYNFRQ
jgi:hypothetical protein